MSSEKRCMGCMNPLTEGDAACRQCGYPIAGVNPPEYLPVRTLLNGRYLIGRVLEIGGDSAVYIGLDRQDNSRVTVREFFPPLLAQRAHTEVTPVGGNENVFSVCRTKFLNLARAVAHLRDVLAVVPSYDIFEENGTAYSVSTYCEGVSLEKYVEKRGGKLPVEEVRRMFLPLIQALVTIHATGMLHLAISPKNVLVDNEGHLCLKNFAITEVRTESGVGKPSRVAGFAAPEQYENGATCTAATDVYGVAATMYFALTGRAPAEAAQRAKRGDELMMPAEVADTLPPYIKESLQRALRLSVGYRTRTAEQLLDELSATQAVASLRETEEEPMKQEKRFPYLWLIFGVVAVALAIVAVFALSGLGYINFGGSAPTTTVTQPSLTMKPTTSTDTVGTIGTGKALFEVAELRGTDLEVAQGMVLSGQMKVVLKGYEYSDTFPKGQIVSQTPAPGDKVERGTPINVVISAGPLEGTMPDVTGWSETHARLYLKALGYQVGESLLLQVSDLEKGAVEKSQPAAGAPIKVGDTVVLWVSNVEQSKDTLVGNE